MKKESKQSLRFADAKRKILLVLEDEKPLLEVIKDKLETEGFDVVTAKAVTQALDYLKEGVKIDAVWLDHYLFGKDSGLDFVKALNKNNSWKKVPVFLVSNTVSPDKVSEYLKLGVQKCYTKVDYRLDQIIVDIKKNLESLRHEENFNS